MSIAPTDPAHPENRIRVSSGRGSTLLNQDFALVVDERPSDLRSADVYPDGMHERQHY